MTLAVLVLDVGLTAVKASLVGEDGTFLAQARRFRSKGTGDGRSDRGALDPWPVMVEAVGDLWRGNPGLRERVSVRAVVSSVAAQTGIGLDRAGHFVVLPPMAPPWRRKADRTMAGDADWEAEAETLAQDPAWGPDGMIRYGYAGILALTVRSARQGAAPLGLTHVGPLHAYVVFCLAGRYATDPASGPDDETWPEPVFRLSGLPRASFPVLLPSEAVAGELTGGAGRSLGLLAGIPVVTGGHDGVCSSFGAGAYRPGEMALTLSTNFVPRPVSGLRVKGQFGYAIRPGGWAWVDGKPLAGTQLDRARAFLWPGVRAGAEPVGALAVQGREAYEGRCAGVPDLPYLDPARLDEQERRLGRLLEAGMSKRELWIGVHRGLAVALAERVREGDRIGVRPPRAAVVTGGASRDDLLVALLSRELGMTVSRANPEAGSLGAAALAAPAIGWARTPEDALEGWRSLGRLKT